MLRALNLLYSPEKEWEKMSLSPPHLLTTILVSILPLLIVSLWIEGAGLSRFGEARGNFGLVRLSSERVFKYEAFSAIASLLTILAGSKLLQNVGRGFELRVSFAVCFTLMSFAYTPIFLARVPDAIPALNTWVCWGIGAALSTRILYHGVALWLKPEQTKGFGLFLLTLIYIVVLSGLVHFASVQVLHGRFLKGIFPDRAPPAAIVPGRIRRDGFSSAPSPLPARYHRTRSGLPRPAACLWPRVFR